MEQRSRPAAQHRPPAPRARPSRKPGPWHVRSPPVRRRPGARWSDRDWSQGRGAEDDMAGISLGQARTIVDAALRKARETGCAPLAIAVLDDGGHLKAFAREDGAG